MAMPEWLSEREWVRDQLEQLRGEISKAGDRLWYIIVSLLLMLLGTAVNTVLNVLMLQGK
jgi:hypothetical protein